MNSAKQCVNSEPMWGYCSRAQKKKKKKKGRKRRREETRYANGHNKVIVLHALIWLRKARYQFDDVEPGLEIISRTGKLVALVHVNHIKPRKPQAHLIIESVYAA